MTARVAAIWRHPIKSCGRERVTAVTLRAGEAMPFDRRWALVHDAARDLPEGAWVPGGMLQIGTRTPALAAIWAEGDETRAEVTLRHPALGTLAVRPDEPEDADRLVAWVDALCPPTRSRPLRVVALPGRGYTDTDYPSVSLLNLASHEAVEGRLGPLEPERWRANLWVEGWEPWAEEGLVGRRLRVGGAVLEVAEEIRRCLLTATNPATGERDADTLGALDALRGRRDCGLYARVVEGGEVVEGAAVEAL